MATELETQSGQTSETASAAQAALVEPIRLNLERGRRLLAHLHRAAQAARLEVQVAELESVLAQAQAGDGSHLELWLDNFYDKAAAVPQSDVRPPSKDAPAAVSAAAEEVTQAASGWAAYVPHAERRLREHEALESQEPDTKSATAQTLVRVADLRNNSAEPADRPSACADLHNKPCADHGARSKPIRTKRRYTQSMAAKGLRVDVQNLIAPENVPAALDNPHSPTIAKEPGEPGKTVTGAIKPSGWLPVKHGSLDAASLASLGTLSERSEPGSRTLSRRTLSGVGLSLVGHGALLSALFMITYRPQRDPASLGSAVLSVNAVAENIETGQPFDVLEPIEMDLSETSPASAELTVADMSNNALANLDSAYSSQSAASSLASAANTTAAGAISAAMDNAGRGSAGAGSGQGRSGVPKLGGQFFGAGAGGNFFCYVVDSSGSMRGGAWESAKIELLRSLTTLAPAQRFYVIFFSQEVCAIPEPGLREPAAHGLYATPENIDHARRWIETVKLDRGGPPNDALGMAIDRQPDAIYLLTDGVTKVDVCSYLREHNRSFDIVSGEQVRVPIHPIAYYSLDGQKLLKQLASENQGQFHYVPAK